VFIVRTDYLTSLPDHWRDIAAIFNALGDDLRQRILLVFEPGEELSIKAIAELFPVSRTTVVHHLQVLQRCGLLSVRRAGRDRLYSVNRPLLLDALQRVRDYVQEDAV
jgi:DNA-binding transcriptional ArsR family regulator